MGIVHHFAVVDLNTAVCRQLVGPLQGVLDILGGHFAAVLVLARMEVYIVTQGEGVDHTSVVHFPIGGQGRNDLAVLRHINDRITYLGDDVAFISTGIVNRIQLCRGSALSNNHNAALFGGQAFVIGLGGSFGAVIPGGPAAAIHVAFTIGSRRAASSAGGHRRNHGSCQQKREELFHLLHRFFLSSK